MHAIFEDYLELLDEADSASQTCSNNRRSFELFDQFLTAEGLDAEEIKLANLRAWLKWLLGQYKASTVARHAICVRAAYKHAHELGVLAANPTSGLSKLVPKPVDKQPEVLTAEQLRAVYRAITTPREDMVFHLLLWTGARAAELRPLRWQPWNGSYVDFENDQLVLLGKGGKIRFCPLHPILRRKLEDWKVDHGNQTCVIESGHHRQMSRQTWATEVKNLLERAGVHTEMRSHLFRKTLNTNLLRQGVPEHVLDVLFGWAPTTIRTKHYSGVAADEVRHAILKAYADDPVVPSQGLVVDDLIDKLQDELERLKALRPDRIRSDA